MTSLGDQHRMFIQAFMWKKFFSSDEVRQLHKECHAKNKVPRTDLKNFVDRINSAISPMNMAIKKGTDEISGEDYYVLINADDNQISRLSSEYKPKELELFKKIINSIVLSDEGKVKSIDALNLADEINVSKKDGEEIVNKFCEDGWLLKDDGCIIFATRAIVELQHFLRKEFKDDITLCTLCQNIVFQGDTCTSCRKKIHHHCRNKYFSGTRNTRCPNTNCKVEWK